MSNISPNQIYNALDGTNDFNNINDDTDINGNLTVNGSVTASTSITNNGITYLNDNTLSTGKVQITNTTPTTPSRNLEVIGNARISEVLVDDNIIETMTHYLFIDDCLVNVRGNRGVTGTGKMSIGYTNKTDPSATLDINGGILFNDGLTGPTGNFEYVTGTKAVYGPTGTFTNLGATTTNFNTMNATIANVTNLNVSGTIGLTGTVTAQNFVATNSVVATNGIQANTMLSALKDITFTNIMSSGGTPSNKTLSVTATSTFTKPTSIDDSLAVAGTRFSTDYLTVGRGGTGSFFRCFANGCGITDNGVTSTLEMDNDGNKATFEHNNNKPIIFNQTYSGGVGIGGDPGAYKARVVSNAAQYAMNITNTNTGAGGGLFIDNISTSASSVPFYIRCNNTATSAMYVKGSNGWVDMGGTNPITQLEIEQPNGGDICIKDDNIGDYNNMSVQFKTAASPTDFTLGGLHQYISDLRMFGWGKLKFYPGQSGNQNTGFQLTSNSNAFEGTYTQANDKPFAEMTDTNTMRIGYDSSGNTFTPTYKLDLGNGSTSPHLAIIRSLNVYPRIFEGYYYTTNNIKVLRNTISDYVTATYNGAWLTQIRLYGSSKYGGFMEGSSSGNPIYHYWSALALPQSTGFDYMKLYNATWNTPTVWGSDVNFNFELVRNGSAGHYNFYVRIIFFEGYQGG